MTHEDPTTTSINTNGDPASSSELDLDSIVLLDQTWYQEGYEEGHEAGRARGHKEGKDVGKAKGYEIGCELGYYKACCQTWLAVLRSAPLPAAAVEGEEGEVGEEIDATTEASAAAAIVMDETTKERAIKTMEGIVKRVDEFPKHNAPDIDMAEQVQRLRAKFRAAASMIGVSVAFSLHKGAGGAGGGGGASGLIGGGGGSLSF